MRKISCLPLLLVLASWTPVAHPAESAYSIDGNLWYEFEVVVFARDYRPGPQGEGTSPDLIDADYLPRIRALSDPGAGLRVTFPGESTLEALAPGAERVLDLTRPIPTVSRMGPDYSPPVRDAVRLTDFASDPFVDITDRAAALGAVLSTLDRAGGYQVLWHRVWRQALRDGDRTPALLVAGGNSYGAHHELQGSLRVRGNDTRMTLDLVLWLSRFAPSGGVDNPWHLPEPPMSQAQETPASAPAFPALPATQATLSPQWVPREIWQLQQTQEITAPQLHYIDHPTLGVLIQARPYQLPLSAEDASDF